jgi:hypothetical protein
MSAVPGTEILRILIEECGWNPSETNREMFAYHYDKADHGPLEYRFMGALGWGGKLHMDGDRLYVTCYRENETPERLAMIERANRRLAELVAS